MLDTFQDEFKPFYNLELRNWNNNLLYTKKTVTTETTNKAINKMLKHSRTHNHTRTHTKFMLDRLGF